jgi:hypothetical protein
MGRNDGAIKALAHRGLEGLRASMAKNARTVAPTREAVPDPLDRARHAVAEVAQHRTDHTEQESRAQQLARWHTDDQTTRQQSRRQDLALTPEGAAP